MMTAVIIIAAFLLRQGLVVRFGLELPLFITVFPSMVFVALFFGLWPGLLAKGAGRALGGLLGHAPVAQVLRHKAPVENLVLGIRREDRQQPVWAVKKTTSYGRFHLQLRHYQLSF